MVSPNDRSASAYAAVTVYVDGAETAEKLQALRSPATYQGATAVEVIETHFAWVFLAGEQAYKMKKPATYPQLDLRSVMARQSSCLEEVRLNRRLGPDVYRGVVRLVRGADGKLRLGGEGTAVDWLVWMKRLPASLMLDRAISAGTTSALALESVGVLLAQFYSKQQRIEFQPDEYLARFKEQIQADQIALSDEQLRLDGQCLRAALAEAYLGLSERHARRCISNCGGKAG